MLQLTRPRSRRRTDIEMEVGQSLGSMSLKEEKSKEVSGGAAGKFKKKNNEKKKKNKIKNF